MRRFLFCRRGLTVSVKPARFSMRYEHLYLFLPPLTLPYLEVAYINTTKQKYDGSVLDLIDAANGSAAALVNLLASDFPCFADIHAHPARRQPIRILKRAQIFVADLWACFEGQSYGSFPDIDKITMFADYRVPQMLWQLNCLLYGPTLEAAVREKRMIEHGSEWEMQLRACSIWCVELIRREIIRQNPEEARGKVNAVLIDFLLYDDVKELEAEGRERIPHHRTRSIWY